MFFISDFSYTFLPTTVIPLCSQPALTASGRHAEVHAGGTNDQLATILVII